MSARRPAYGPPVDQMRRSYRKSTGMAAEETRSQPKMAPEALSARAPIHTPALRPHELRPPGVEIPLMWRVSWCRFARGATNGNRSNPCHRSATDFRTGRLAARQHGETLGWSSRRGDMRGLRHAHHEGAAPTPPAVSRATRSRRLYPNCEQRFTDASDSRAVPEVSRR